LGADIVVKRNDQVSIDDIKSSGAGRICISPGPGRPENAGISENVIREFAGKMPILGVCLGHQCIAQVFGGEVIRAPRLMHGKTSVVHHSNRGVFQNLQQPLEATRYHSLIVRRDGLPSALEITAETDQGEIMGLQHKEFPVHGVQFHPESILTVEGKKLLANFLRL
jgi:anthranilate synthase/aminodeoxychorismate synthase-like glutamine amidotransferase